MPECIAPVKSRAHRLACISLYRALLQQCCSFHLPSAPSSSLSKSKATLSNLVRNRFKKDKTLKNWQQIRNALQLGRAALQLLQAAGSGSSKALHELTAVLSSSVEAATSNIKTLKDIRAEQSSARLSRKHTEAKEREARRADKSNYRRRPDTIPVLQRPVPYDQALKHEDGRRKVPQYFTVNGIAFLRYTHKQPMALSRYITQQIRASDKALLKKEKHNAAIDLAELEDQWDRLLLDEHGLQSADKGGYMGDTSNSWATHHYDARREVAIKVRKTDEKRAQYSRKLFDVMLKEERLAKQENEARKEENRRK